MKVIIFLILLVGPISQIHSQGSDLSIQYGRFWAPYYHQDYGTGLRKTPKSNYNFFPSVTFNKYFSRNLSAEVGLYITIYGQYYGTRKYLPAFASTYGAGHLSIKAGYSIIKNEKFECRAKTGFAIGIMPDQYLGEYTEILVYPVFDSISRGNIKRDYTPVFVTAGVGMDLSYKVARRLQVSIGGLYHKGFSRITEYDIYYNDGTGNNDQRAKQWGKGDFYGVQLGLRYKLLNKSRNSKSE